MNRVQRTLRQCVVGALIAMTGGATARGDVLLAAAERFAVSTNETPDFQRHVVPLLGRSGCNGRACHGSFQGRGGLQLSLFGYDFAKDHKSLTSAGSAGGKRVDTAKPADSLILRKPTELVDHEGGERFAVGSWPHRLLENW